MTEQPKPAGVGGSVLPLRITEEIARQTASDIGILFPGWRVWFETKPGQWYARREGTILLGPGDERVLAVSAGDVACLVALLERQVRLDLAVEFPDWEITQPGTGGWQAGYRGDPARPSGHAVLRVIRHPAIAGLHAAVRELVTREGR